jgi:hypothetical protein
LKLKFAIGLGLGVLVASGVALVAQTPKMHDASAIQKEIALIRHATGSFEVKMSPQTASEPFMGSYLLDKQYHGDLEATAKGQMISAGSGGKGTSGAYMALEQVTGTLQGHTGSFVLVHRGIMNRGVPELLITIVPDSGTGELVGIAGKMEIKIADGKHSYSLEYTLTSTQ